MLGLLVGAGAACSASDVSLEDEPADTPVEQTASEIVATSNDATTLAAIPFYFAMPKHSLFGTLETERKAYPWRTVWNLAKDKGSAKDLGLRMIVIPENGVRSRRAMATQLGKAGVLKDGDIVLSFRTLLADTMAYPHIQMGSTHAGLTFLEEDGGVAHNLDQPLDGDYNRIQGGRFVGSFDSKHYVGQPDSTDALHVLRPRWSNEDRPRRATNLRAWVAQLGTTHERIRSAGGLDFNSDYLKPLMIKYGSPGAVATKFGKIVLGQESPPDDFDMFCSEFAYFMLTLSNCTLDEIRSASDTATCAENGAPFTPMKLVTDPNTGVPGLAEGPLFNLLSTSARPTDAASISNALDTIFPAVPGANGAKLSSGHRAVAETTKPLMAGIQGYYAARLSGNEAQAEQIAIQLNASALDLANYSPTAFLVNATLPSTHPNRTIDYVATIVFTDARGVRRAGTIVRPGPVPGE